MSIYNYKSHEVFYLVYGEESAPVIAFINGLSMRTAHWMPMIENLCASGFRVLVYDMLGQGASSKPVLDMMFDENAMVLAGLLDELGAERAYVSGISYGGVVALKFGYLYPEKVRGLIPISTFTEMDGQFRYRSMNLYRGLTEVGFDFYIDLLMPLNFTSIWIDEHSNILEFTKRIAVAGMEVYGIQNIMEQLVDFTSITENIADIKCPTLIMNGEYDVFTPRHMHEIIMNKIGNSQLVIVPRVAHAMTIEIPDLCCQIIADFVDQVENGVWNGDQTVWIAEERLGVHPVRFPCVGDYLRNIPIEMSLEHMEKCKQEKQKKIKSAVKTKTKTKTKTKAKTKDKK